MSAVGNYLGHNIVAFLVDSNGKIVLCDFNHNEIFQNKGEHAENRVLYIQSRTFIGDSKSFTLYTSLEPCHMCLSAVTERGVVGELVFLMEDPDQKLTEKILEFKFEEKDASCFCLGASVMKETKASEIARNLNENFDSFGTNKPQLHPKQKNNHQAPNFLITFHFRENEGSDELKKILDNYEKEKQTGGSIIKEIEEIQTFKKSKSSKTRRYTFHK